MTLFFALGSFVLEVVSGDRVHVGWFHVDFREFVVVSDHLERRCGLGEIWSGGGNLIV